jgi:hypothetical protein
MLTIDEQAQMLQNFFNYAQGIEPVLNTSGLKLVWSGMKFLLEQDHKKYCDAVQRARGTKTKSMVPQRDSMALYDTIRKFTVPSDNVNVNDNVDGNDRATASTVDTVSNPHTESLLRQFDECFNK